MTGWWFSPGRPVSSTNKTNCHDITEILLKLTLSTLSHLLWDCMVVGAITTKVVSSNLADDEVYSRQHYVIMFVSDL